MKILQPNDTDASMLSAMYVYEHNHEFPSEPHLELSAEVLGVTRKRKESDVPSDEHTSKRQLNSSQSYGMPADKSPSPDGFNDD